MKKVLNRIGNILIWLVVAVTVCIVIFTVLSVSTFDRSDREIFGYSAFIVMSDSMSRTDFDAGDVVLVKNVDPSTLKEGDIIAFTSVDRDNYGETVTHKIRHLTTDADGNPGFITYGTTTDTDDSAVVTYDYILGKYQWHIPKIGSFFHFLKTTPGYIMFILVPFALLILFQVLNCVKAIREYRAEQLDGIQAERAKLEEERRQTEKLVLKLEALQAQMGGAELTEELEE
ncbi:MAG: signal peptidase I [Lachnospiraceae bacterium]|nr:signal peptidase I [Lachnospiraceae bacterium]